MKTQKNEYKEGFWNVNTVLLGGLGKDPVLEGKIRLSLFRFAIHDSESGDTKKGHLKCLNDGTVWLYNEVMQLKM